MKNQSLAGALFTCIFSTGRARKAAWYRLGELPYAVGTVVVFGAIGVMLAVRG